MGLETATYIDQLVSSNPVHTDGLNQADAHLRLLKSVLQSQFPNFTAAPLNSTNAAIDAAVTAAGNAGVVSPTSGTFLLPPGVVLEYGAAAAPAGFLICDGTSYSTTTYAALFAAIGYTYGGSGANFNVPDRRGRVGVGIDSVSRRLGSYAGSALAATVGEASHTLSTSEMPVHAHTLNDPGHYHAVNVAAHDFGHVHTVSDPGHGHTFPFANASGGANGYPAPGNATTNFTGTVSAAVTNISVELAYTGIPNFNSSTTTTGITMANAGSGSAHNNVQPGLVMNYIIKT